MGSIMGKALDESMEKNKEFSLMTQQLQMERQLAMTNEMRERQMAMMIAQSRDLFWYFISFYSVFSVALTSSFIKRKNPAYLAPLVPLTILGAYQWDMAYGHKLSRMRGMACGVIEKENSLLDLPHGMPTFESIEAARLKAEA